MSKEMDNAYCGALVYGWLISTGFALIVWHFSGVACAIGGFLISWPITFLALASAAGESKR